MFDKYRLNVLGDIGCLTPFLAKMNMYIPAELKSINVPPTRSKTVWFFSSDRAKLSLIKQLPSRLSSSLPQPILFDFSRSIPTARPQIGSWIDSFHPRIVQIGHTGGLALILPFISGTGISSFLFLSPLVISPTEFLFLLKLRYLKQDKTFFYFTVFIIPTIYLSVMGAHLWFTPPELKLNCPWNLLYIVWFIYTTQCTLWVKL